LYPDPAPTVPHRRILGVLVLLLSGCASEPTRTPPPVPEAQARPPVATAPLPPERPSYRGPWEDPTSPLYQRTIYFDYDSVEIKPEYIALMRNHAAYLGTNTSTRVTLEGHTDERGTREYNLALGDQRAETVRRFMVAEGVIPQQMATLSYGEERPADPGRTEAAWERNRRVIIQY
jgi:peptidoglycan-associated lipoprotein